MTLTPVAPNTPDRRADPTNSSAATRNISAPLDIRRSVRMHRKAAITVAAVVALVLLAYGLARRPYYQTQALIYVQPMKTTTLSNDTTEPLFDVSRYESFMQQQLQTVVRQDILADALRKPSAAGWRFPGEQEKAAVLRLQNSLKVERVNGSYEISITLSGGNPVVIANVVNAVCESYVRGERNDELGQSDSQVKALREERESVKVALTEARKRQVELSANLGSVETSPSGAAANPYETQLTDLRSELTKAKAAHQVAAAELNAVGDEGDSSNNLNSAAAQIIAADPGLSSLKQTIGQRRSAIASQMAGLTAENPIYQQDQQELKRLDESQRNMETEVRNRSTKQVRNRLELELQRTADIQRRLSQQVNATIASAANVTPQVQQAGELAADIARLQARYNQVAGAINGIELAKDTAGQVHLLLAADVPLGPKRSLKLIIVILAFPLAIFMGIGVAMLLSRYDSRVYISREVASILSSYPMAALPSAAEVSKHVQDEFMLRVLAGIDQIHRVHGCKTFVFTAAGYDDDGIEEIVSSLASKMTRLGYAVSVADAHDLVDEKNISSGTFEADKEAALAAHPHGGNAVVEKINALHRKSDFLLVFAPALLSSSVAEFAARLSDVMVLVAKSGVTSRGEIRSSHALLRRLRVGGFTTILTDVSLQNADDGFIRAVQRSAARVNEA